MSSSVPVGSLTKNAIIRNIKNPMIEKIPLLKTAVLPDSTSRAISRVVQ